MNANGSHVDFAGVTHASSARSLASVTGRLGYAWDRFLLYVRGGGAWERDNYASTVPPIVGAAVVPGFTITGSETRSGWTIGVGGEYAFTNFLSGFIEYDYYNFGTRAVNFTNPIIPGTVAFDIRERKSVIKGGLNFRFGGGPVVARY
jgi:outer membrane immunogenic protein